MVATLALLLAGHAAPQRVLAASQTFRFTGGEQTFTVPAGVTSIHVVAIGGAGASGGNTSGGSTVGGAGGFGASVSGDLSVTAGQTLYVEVGGNGSGAGGGFNGGGTGDPFSPGGGGASDVRTLPRILGWRPAIRA